MTRAHSTYPSAYTFAVLINNDDQHKCFERAARRTSCPAMTYPASSYDTHTAASRSLRATTSFRYSLGFRLDECFV